MFTRIPLIFLIFSFFLFHWCHESYAIDQASVEIFTTDGKYGLRDNQGNTIVPATYNKIGWSDGLQLPVDGVIGYFENGWGLMTIRGKRLTGPDYYTLEGIHRQLLVASLKAKHSNELLYGALSSRATVVIDFQYHSMKSEGSLIVVSKRSSKGSLYGLIDHDGKRVTDLDFASVSHYNGDLFIVQNQQHQKGLINQESEYVLIPQFDQLEKPINGMSVVMKNGAYGIVDDQGKIVKDAIYKEPSAAEIVFSKLQVRTIENEMLFEAMADSIVKINDNLHAVFRNGFAVVENASGYAKQREAGVSKIFSNLNVIVISGKSRTAILNAAGDLLMAGSFDEVRLSKYYFYVREGKLWSVYDHSGQRVSKWKVDEVIVHDDHLIPFRKDKFWGYFDGNGEVVISAKYEEVTPYSGDLARVKYLGYDMVINRRGKVVIGGNYQRMTIHHQDYILARSGRRLDLYSPEGFQVYQTYNEVMPITSGYLERTLGGYYGFVTAEGRQAFDPIYDTLINIGSRYMQIVQGDKVGLAQIDGTVLIQPSRRYQAFGNVAEGKVAVRINGAWGFINMKEQLLIANRYEDVTSFTNDLAAVKMNGHWGIINAQEQIAVQPNFDNMKPCLYETMVVERGGKFGVLDTSGRTILDVTYDEVVKCENGCLVLRRADKYGVYDAKGKPIIPLSFDSIDAGTGDYFVVKRRGKHAVMNRNGHYAVPLKYDFVEEFRTGQFLCVAE